MATITKHDTNGTKPLLNKGEFGYDDYVTGGDAGRVYVGTGTENIPLANKDEITSAVSNAVAALVDSAPNTLDTLNEFALALGNDENFAATTASAIGSKISKVSTPVLNAVPRVTADGTLQNSGVIIDDNNNVTVVNQTAAGLVSINTGVTNPIADTRLAQIIIGNTTSTASARIAGYTDGNWSDGVSSPTSLRFYTTTSGSNAVTERMRIDTNGNVGIGTTPSAWSGVKAIELSGTAVFASAGSSTNFSTNGYYNGSSWIYKNTGRATNYTQDTGVHTWYTAPSGTAGNTLTLTNAMSLNSNGNLLVGTSTDNGVDKLQVNGSIKTNFGVNTFEGRTPYIGSNSSWSVMVKDPNYVYFTNLNDVIKSGRYNCQGSEVSNCPNSVEWFYIDVMSHANREDSNSWVQQIAYPMGTAASYAVGTFFIRLRIYGVWSAWVQK